jgi:hypothetical protein
MMIESIVSAAVVAFHPYLLKRIITRPLMRLDLVIFFVSLDRFMKQMGKCYNVITKNVMLIQIDLGEAHLPLIVRIAYIMVTLRVGFESIDQILAVA